MHMSWGAANERSAAAGYKRLVALEKHPALTPLLKAVAAQESRHIAFYAAQARKRLEASAKARALNRFVMSRFSGPVGSGVMPEEEVDHVMRHLFSGPDGSREVHKLGRADRRAAGARGPHDHGRRVPAQGPRRPLTRRTGPTRRAVAVATRGAHAYRATPEVPRDDHRMCGAE